VLLGVVSWAGARCGADHLPSVFAQVSRYRTFIADVPFGTSAITLRQLLNMRSGLFDYLNDGDTTVTGGLLTDPSHRWAPLDLIAITNRHAPHFAPDTAWSYCNTCYVLLGEIIERTTGHLLAEELRQRIFVPAGLRATSFDTEPRIAGRHAHGYERLGKKLRPTDVTAVSPTYIWAAGAIVSTASDVARFYSKLYADTCYPRPARGHADHGPDGS
jgi:D-alanyl-D-alanine carboxypeptidase